MKKLGSIAICLVVAAALVGCGDSRRDKLSDQTKTEIEAYKLIDSGRTEEAIQLLENKLARLLKNIPSVSKLFLSL